MREGGRLGGWRVMGMRRGVWGDHRGNVGNEPEKSLPRKCLFGKSGHSESADEEEVEAEDFYFT